MPFRSSIASDKASTPPSRSSRSLGTLVSKRISVVPSRSGFFSRMMMQRHSEQPDADPLLADGPAGVATTARLWSQRMQFRAGVVADQEEGFAGLRCRSR